MRARVLALLVLVVLVGAHARPARALDDLAAQERLGARIGYVETYDGVYQYFGPGWDVLLYFNERIHSRLFLDLHVGAIYLGDILDPELDDFITRYTNVESEMRMFYFSLGLAYGFPLGKSPYTLTTSLAAGVYSVSVAFVSDFVSDDVSDSYFGGNGSIGLMRRLGTGWALEANCTLHYFDTSAGYSDLLWVFTATEAVDPVLFGVSLGLAVDLR
ncbi:MAG TPA: hypothetical protein VEC56_12600 [Candidatus Krumholzibacteria bacterium]|nr:hypothetical protein [Candidatus Krumholzibacteria bacterium]